MVEWLALRAGSRLLLMPKAEAMELAPKQSAEADDPLASRSEGFLFVTEIALVKLRSGGLGHQEQARRSLGAVCPALPIASWFGSDCQLSASARWALRIESWFGSDS